MSGTCIPSVEPRFVEALDNVRCTKLDWKVSVVHFNDILSFAAEEVP
jgi:hypothetical protein